eukprot:GILJ01011681.1.p1 GENE.GILJ01011681.1~~GILJ01011681.1.p1  ORF type:complete len:404 (-),score=80.17 GILJ01011681.1:12-1223(-)
MSLHEVDIPKEGQHSDNNGETPARFRIIGHTTLKETFGSYIAYELQRVEPPSSVTFFRRFSDFVWLQEQLALQFPGIRIPPLPPKQVLSRFDQETIDAREICLQHFLDRMATAPMLLKSEHFVNFILSSEQALQSTKKESLSKRAPVTVYIQQYSTAFAEILTKALPERFSTELTVFREYLDAVYKQLLAARGFCAELVINQKLRLDSTHRLATELKILAEREQSHQVASYKPLLSDALYGWSTLEDKERSSCNGLNGWLKQMDRHLRDVESMRIALHTRDSFLRRCEDFAAAVTRHIEAIQQIKRGKQENAFKSLFFGQKLGSLEERENALAEARSMESSYRDFVSVLDKILFHQEIQRFALETVSDFNETMRKFATLQTDKNKQLISVWSTLELGLSESSP